jgi:hypothetical protein
MTAQRKGEELKKEWEIWTKYGDPYPALIRYTAGQGMAISDQRKGYSIGVEGVKPEEGCSKGGMGRGER